MLEDSVASLTSRTEATARASSTVGEVARNASSRVNVEKKSSLADIACCGGVAIDALGDQQYTALGWAQANEQER